MNMQAARHRKQATDKVSPSDLVSSGGNRLASDSSISSSSSGSNVMSEPSNDSAGTHRKVVPLVGKLEDDMTETWWQIGLQVFFPYIVAGLGMVGAGVVLNIVKVC